MIVALLAFVVAVAIVGVVEWRVRAMHARLIAPTGVTVLGTHVCEVCRVALPETTVRTHDGHWRCGAHKAT